MILMTQDASLGQMMYAKVAVTTKCKTEKTWSTESLCDKFDGLPIYLIYY